MEKTLSNSSNEEVIEFFKEFKEGKLVKSAQRYPNDLHPDHTGLTWVTSKSFKEICLDKDTEIFLDI